jgi:hypothetical protein
MGGGQRKSNVGQLHGAAKMKLDTLAIWFCSVALVLGGG